MAPGRPVRVRYVAPWIPALTGMGSVNKRRLAIFRRWFVRNAPDGLDFEDPVGFLEKLRAMDRNWASHRNSPEHPSVLYARASLVGKFMMDLVEDYDVAHLSPEELGPIMVEASAAVTIRS